MTDATVNAVTQVERDQKQYKAKQSANTVDLIAHAARQSGKSAFSIGLDARRWKRGKARLQLDEYVKYRLYDETAHTDEERGEFITWMLHNAIIHEVNDKQWFGTTEDKWLSSVLLRADGVPVPDTVAMIDGSSRAYHGIEAISGPEALRSLIGGGLETPLFGKANGGLNSVGVFTITQANTEALWLRDLGEMSYEAFFDNVVGDTPYILQKLVSNHADLREYTETLATVRMVNMIDGDGVYVPAAVLKLPSSRNQADNYWRDGNLICNLDPQTGAILTVVSPDGLDQKFHDLHPETGKEILGRCLPMWQEMRAVNERVARLHSPLKYQSTDMAITDEGPVVIEVNAGGSFQLPQNASGKGFMTPKVRELFRSYGSKIVWE